jgi:transposase InsO family protein
MKIMPTSTKEEKYRWIQPILDKEIAIKNMTKVCPFSERALKYWLAKYRKHGIEGLENRSRRPKTHPKETPIRIKERVIELRKRTRKCALKIKWQLEKEGVVIHKNTVHKIIKSEGLTRKYRARKMRYKYVKVSLKQGELLEVDIKYVPKSIKNKRYYQYTAIDCASRWRYLKIYDSPNNFNSVRFLKELADIAPFKIKAIKTDNAGCFTNRYTGYLKSSDPMNPRLHAFDILCQRLNIIHYLIDPGKPAQNGKVERSHRTDQEMFYDRTEFRDRKELETKLKIWNNDYNNLEHCGLNGLSPNEFLRLSEVQNVCG